MAMDIFDAKISCVKCNERMDQKEIIKDNIKLRAVQCPKCHEKIIHPQDLTKYENFNNIRGKTYNVKLRVVGNSHAISIPKEIVEFMHQQEKTMDEMVRLCFEDMKKLSLFFGGRNDTRS